MSDTVSFAELDGQHVELLPARTVLSMFSARDGGGLLDGLGLNGILGDGGLGGFLGGGTPTDSSSNGAAGQGRN
jgi:hypothetical protein